MSISVQDIPRPVETYHTKPYDRIALSKAKFNGKGQTILITAGATGVGRSIATAFALVDISRVIIVSRSAGPQEKTKSELQSRFPDLEVLTFQVAITEHNRIEEIFRSVGDVDILVLSAAYSHTLTRALDVPVAEVTETFSTNIFGNLNVLRTYLAQPTPRSGSKTVIHVSSGAAHTILPGLIGYGPSKSGFTQVVQTLAAEYTPEKDKVRMFNMHPGTFLTDLAKEVGFDETSLEWEDIRIAGDFAVWLAGEGSFLHGRFVWAQWDVDELLALQDRIVKEPSFLTIGLVL